MTGSSNQEPITIPFRRIICKKCQTAGNTETGFKIYDSEEKGRVAAVCENCGTSNLIKRNC